MNTLTLRLSNYQKIIYKDIKMLVFDMAGTTVNEKGIVYIISARKRGWRGWV